MVVVADTRNDLAELAGQPLNRRPVTKTERRIYLGKVDVGSIDQLSPIPDEVVVRIQSHTSPSNVPNSKVNLEDDPQLFVEHETSASLRQQCPWRESTVKILGLVDLDVSDADSGAASADTQGILGVFGSSATGRRFAGFDRLKGFDSVWNGCQALTLADWESFDVLIRPSTADPYRDNQTSDPAWLGSMLDALMEMGNLERGWDSYDALPPNEWVLNKAQEAIQEFSLRRVMPDNVLPSVENGVGITVNRGDSYGFLEILNCMEIVGVTALSEDDYEVWEFGPDSIIEAVEKICAFITQ